MLPPPTLRLHAAHLAWAHSITTVTTQLQSLRDHSEQPPPGTQSVSAPPSAPQSESSAGVSHSSPLSPHSCFLGGRAFGPPLCGGTPPATPPSKTLAAAGALSSLLGGCVNHRRNQIACMVVWMKGWSSKARVGPKRDCRWHQWHESRVTAFLQILIQTNSYPPVQTISKGSEHDSLHLDGLHALFSNCILDTAEQLPSFSIWRKITPFPLTTEGRSNPSRFSSATLAKMLRSLRIPLLYEYVPQKINARRACRRGNVGGWGSIGTYISNRDLYGQTFAYLLVDRNVYSFRNLQCYC